MQLTNDVIIINEMDPVAVAVRQLAKGETINIKEKSIVVKDDIPVPHKIALREIKKDGVVLSTVIRSVMQPRISDVRLRICM